MVPNLLAYPSPLPYRLEQVNGLLRRLDAEFCGQGATADLKLMQGCAALLVQS
jgi:hypothetical protein